MTYYTRTRITKAAPCTITGEDGELLEGTVITGEDAIRAIIIENDLVRVTYELPEGAEPAAHHMFIKKDGEWRRCFRPGYGDWTFFITPITEAADRVEVIEASADAIEVSFEWTEKSLNNPEYSEGFDGGMVSRDYARNAIFPSNSLIARRIEEVYLRKVIRIERGIRGYWSVWRSDPNVVPKITGPGQVANNEANLGEREFGTGGGSRVVWASTGKIAYCPAWRDQRDWSAVIAAIPSFDNFAWWPGIDDPTYPPWNDATVIAMEPAGFPAESELDYHYIADIPDPDYGGEPNIVRYMAMINPLEAGVWGYEGQLGEVVTHFANPWTEKNGRLTRFTNFTGAEYYEADDTAAVKIGYTGPVDYANEPTPDIQSRIENLVRNLVLPKWRELNG